MTWRKRTAEMLFVGLLSLNSGAQSVAAPASSKAPERSIEQLAEETWLPAQNNGCKIWDEHPRRGETLTWYGACKAGLATGSGTAEWFMDGKLIEKVVASYLEGKLSGKGEVSYAIGSHYEGEFVENKRHGKGVFIWANGTRYEGDFADDDPHGKGVMTWTNGTRYEGDFVKGKRTGTGAWTKNGDRLVGAFEDGKFTGKGVVTLENGVRYEGDFVHGKRTGKGKSTRPDGEQ